jgi:hypothetical protein
MTMPSKAWDQVNERLVALGTQVRTSADKMTKGTAIDRAAFEKSVRDMFSAIEDGFGLAGKAIRDPKIRKDLSNVADSVRQALLATMESAGGQVRGRLPHAPGKRSPKSTGRKAAAPKTATGKAAPVKKATTAKKASTAKRAAPANKVTPVKKAAPARKATVGRSAARKRTAS